MTDGTRHRQSQDGRQKPLEPWRTAGKILSQELRSGCTDRTVIGGLERYLAAWTSSLYSFESASPTWADARQVGELLRGYGQRPHPERERAVRTAVRLVTGVVDRLSALQGDPGRLDHSPRPPEAVATTPSERATSKAKGSPTAEPRTRRPATGTPRSGPTPGLDDPIVTLRGIGRLRASKLAKLGIERVRDLLTHFPRDHRDYRHVKRIADLMYGETVSVVGVVDDVQVYPGPQRRFRTTVKVKDDSGRISATWFRYGYGGVRIAPNTRVALAGTVSGYGYSLALESPDWEPADRPPLHTRRLVPVYPLTEGVTDYWLRELMAEVVPRQVALLEDFLPKWLLEKRALIPLDEAVRAVHLPDGPEELARGRLRLAFDELFVVQLAALRRRAEWRSEADAPSLVVKDEVIEQFLARQPFRLTGAQRRVLAEIRRDLGDRMPMTRLLQGEVGSGKTIVGAVALLAAVVCGRQGALMAPTEILAEQHGRTLRAAFANAEGYLTQLLGRELRLEVLTGASRRAEREAIYAGAATGEVDILVGTHAIIQEGVSFANLGLAIIDEQHRFGVEQRSALRAKGGTPHLLMMTATPIPRTLALTLYGDLDLSIIDELPPGRQQVKTHLLGPQERSLAYEHIRREVASGRQAFLICPLIEDSPHLEVRAATAEYERLRAGELAGLRLALLHGRMRPAEKDRIMLDFRAGEYDVLVSTSVVEVGIDVANATVMLVEGADRFGLAQLHQFRGRVGRGVHPSTCVLLTDATDENALERLKTVEAVADGFKLADEDLRLRGPGEYLGVRQSGFPDFRMADLLDLRLIEVAREAAAELLERDPALAAEEHQALARRVELLRAAGSS